MAASRLGESRPCLWSVLVLLSLLAPGARGQVQLPQYSVLEPSSVPRAYVQRALNFINDVAPNGHTYKHGSLVAAQIMVSPTNQQMYRLTFNMEPVCKGNGETCPRESCTVDQSVNQPDFYEKDSIHCHKLPSKKQDPIVDAIEKQVVINQSVSLDREVQMSSDHNDRPFVAVKASQSEYCPGCPYELKPSLPGLSAFGEQALRAMDEAGHGEFKHKLVSIVRVTRAVPPGLSLIRYQLLMEIGDSSCLRTSHIDVSECPLQSNLPIKLCLVTFEERPWQTGSRRISANNCTNDSLLLNSDNEVSASVDPNAIFFESLAAATPPNRGAAAAVAADSDSAKTEFYDQIAQEAQEVFRMPNMEVSTSGDAILAVEDDREMPHSKVVLAQKPSEPIEASVKFDDKMKEFDKFLTDFDLPVKTTESSNTPANNMGEPVKEEIIVKEHVEEKEEKPEEEVQSQNPTVESKRSKRAISGKALESSKAGLRKLAFKTVEMIDALDEDNKKKHLIDVIESTRERQAHGILYRLTLEVSPTDCREADQSTECLDEVIPGPSQICKCEVFTSEKKPLLAPKLQHYSCKYKDSASETTRPRRQLGAAEAFDKEDPEIKKFVGLGLASYSKSLQGSQKSVLRHEITNVTRQVVAGFLYKIQIKMGLSSCDKTDQENCKLDAAEEQKVCEIRAWTRAWINNGEPEITVTCDGENETRTKRSLRGANYSAKMLEQARHLKEEKLFHEFISKYKRKYASAEEREERFKVFKDNLDVIEELQRNEQGTGRYGVTMFADLTKAEFKARYLGLKPSLRSDNDIPMPQAEIPDIELPNEYDWRHYNAVTPVKNQGACGSCWAFSVTGNVEGQYAIKHGKLLSLSEQELVDCDKLDEGCNGGLPDNAYRAIEELGGLELETDYPYEAENEKCHFSKNKAKVTVVSGLNITSNETQMAQWLVKNGPMSIGINANAMQFYVGGVSHPFHFLCSPSNLDHGVLIVGYGVKTYPIFKKTLPYWLVKNSWGPHWGEQGYYRVYRGDGTCGVNQMVSSAVVA